MKGLAGLCLTALFLIHLHFPIDEVAYDVEEDYFRSFYTEHFVYDGTRHYFYYAGIDKESQ